MAKRKAQELGEAANGGTRRSSRRASAATVALKQEQKSQEPKKNDVAIEANGTLADAVERKPPAKSKKAVPNDTISAPPTKETTGPQYWLMKAEPESRLEKGKDVKFSIDDLAAKSEPEPWDGIRAYPARNNLRAMKKGDLAFFYHSSCKIPAIVGIMEIVEEHTPDLTAHDSSAPYYDPKSTPENPKWSVVHVEFRQKLDTPVTLKEMKEWQSTKGNPLEQMQMLKLGRLSVSAVRKEEWEFLTGVMEKNGEKLFFK